MGSFSETQIDANAEKFNVLTEVGVLVLVGDPSPEYWQTNDWLSTSEL